jgi:hypothetical protein
MNKFLFTLMLTLFVSISHAAIKPEESKQLSDFLQTHHAQAVQTGLAFYDAGQLCYQHQLKSVVYFPVSNTIFFWLNDKQDKCQLAGLYLGEVPPNAMTAKTCELDASMHQSLYQPWYADALKQNPDAPNPVARELFEKIGNCLLQKPISFANLMDLLNTAK